MKVLKKWEKKQQLLFCVLAPWGDINIKQHFTLSCMFRSAVLRLCYGCNTSLLYRVANHQRFVQFACPMIKSKPFPNVLVSDLMVYACQCCDFHGFDFCLQATQRQHHSDESCEGVARLLWVIKNTGLLKPLNRAHFSRFRVYFRLLQGSTYWCVNIFYFITTYQSELVNCLTASRKPFSSRGENVWKCTRVKCVCGIFKALLCRFDLPVVSCGNSLSHVHRGGCNHVGWMFLSSLDSISWLSCIYVMVECKPGRTTEKDKQEY